MHGCDCAHVDVLQSTVTETVVSKSWSGPISDFSLNQNYVADAPYYALGYAAYNYKGRREPRERFEEAI